MVPSGLNKGYDIYHQSTSVFPLNQQCASISAKPTTLQRLVHARSVRLASCCAKTNSPHTCNAFCIGALASSHFKVGQTRGHQYWGYQASIVYVIVVSLVLWVSNVGQARSVGARVPIGGLVLSIPRSRPTIFPHSLWQPKVYQVDSSTCSSGTQILPASPGAAPRPCPQICLQESMLQEARCFFDSTYL